MWLTKLQIAIVEKNTELIDILVSQMPKFETKEEMESAAVLIKEALKLLHKLKDETGDSLKKLKKHKDFLNSTRVNKTAKFDVIS
ncbi:hypothetical protein [Sulfurimonas sp.]